jgi:non-specific serine/threonine protein kinase
MPVEQILARLDDRFALLTEESSAAPSRHQTLRTTVGWSHELCEPRERLLWARLAVFPGDFDLEAVEAVCADEHLPGELVFELLARLVDKSVLLAEARPEAVRYRMLDTVREFGQEWQRALGERETLARRQRDHYLALAERFDADWFGPRQAEWTRRMRAELPNVRAAFDYTLAAPAGAQAGLRLAAALFYYWWACGEAREGRLWLERALAADPAPSGERVRALAAYGRLLNVGGISAAAVDVARECIAATRVFDEPTSRARALEDLGSGLMYLGDMAAAIPLWEEAVALAAGQGDDAPELAFAAFHLAWGHLLDGDPVRAMEVLPDAVAVCRVRGDRWWLATCLYVPLHASLALGDTAQADAYGRESLRLLQGLGDAVGASAALEYLAWTAAAAGDHPRAARLLGASDRQWRALGESPLAGEWAQKRLDYEAAARGALGAAAFDADFHSGGRLTFDEAVAYALGPLSASG